MHVKDIPPYEYFFPSSVVSDHNREDRHYTLDDNFFDWDKHYWRMTSKLDLSDSDRDLFLDSDLLKYYRFKFFPYQYPFENPLANFSDEWAKENLAGPWTDFYRKIIAFHLKEDAIKFILSFDVQKIKSAEIIIDMNMTLVRDFENA